MSPVAAIGPVGGSISPGTPVLDLLSTAPVSGYSLRKLRAAYAGNAISVRRDSDNTTKDIGFTRFGDIDLTALLAWVGAGSGYIATWYDQVGSNDLTASGGNAQQPRIVNAGVVETTPDGSIGANFGWGGTGSVSLGTNNVNLLKNSISYTFGESYTVYATNDAGPGTPTDVNEVIFQPVSAPGGLVVDHNSNTSVSQYGLDNPGDSLAENNLSPTYISGDALSSRLSYGAVNTQVWWHEGGAALTDIRLGLQTGSGLISNGFQALDGWIVEHLIFSLVNSLSTGDKATLFANQKSYYAINLSLLHDGQGYQLTVAFSTRKLRRGYAGKCMNVRRSSDNATQDIGFIGANLDTAALTAFVGSNDGFVVTWYDQSPWANHVTQATLANQPQIVSSGTVLTLNGKPVLKFNTSVSGTISLQRSSVNHSPCVMGGVYIVEKSDLATFPLGSTPCPFSVFSGGGQTAVIFGTQGSANFDNAVNAAHFTNVNNSGLTSTTAQLEQLGAVTTSKSNFASATNLAIGTQPGGTNPAWVGSIGEVVCSVVGPVTAGDILYFYTNQKAWWGTP